MADTKNAAFFEIEGHSVCGIIRSIMEEKIDEITETCDENGKIISRQENQISSKIILEMIFPAGTVLPAGSSVSLKYAGRIRQWIVTGTVTIRVNRDFMQAAVTAVSDE